MQSHRLAIPLGGGHPTCAFIRSDWRIDPHIGVAPCDKARSATVYNAMGVKPSALKTQNDISQRYVGSSCGLHIEHIASTERGKHAVASNAGPHPSMCSENLQKQLILCLLKTVSTHRETLVWNHVEKTAIEILPAAALLRSESHFRSVGAAIAACKRA